MNLKLTGQQVQSGRRINLGSNSNFLRIKNDSAQIYLPYFGTLTNGAAAMTNDTGVEFSGLIENYEMTVDDKKQKISVTFNDHNKKRYVQLLFDYF